MIKELLTKNNLDRKVKGIKKFQPTTSFEAFHKASKEAQKKGYTVGSMCCNAPIGIGIGYDYIAKWWNISYTDQKLVDGVILSKDFRDGTVYLVEFAS